MPIFYLKTTSNKGELTAHEIKQARPAYTNKQALLQITTESESIGAATVEVALDSHAQFVKVLPRLATHEVLLVQ